MAGGGTGANRGRGVSVWSGRGFSASTIPQTHHVPSAQGQTSAQGQGKGFCLDNIGSLMRIPNAGCSRQQCKFDHYTDLRDIDRIPLESNARGILKFNVPKLTAFLAAMGIVKFRGE